MRFIQNIPSVTEALELEFAAECRNYSTSDQRKKDWQTRRHDFIWRRKVKPMQEQQRNIPHSPVRQSVVDSTESADF